jgi:hypothetical protein
MFKSNMNTKHWRNHISRVTPIYLEKTPFQCHLFYHNSRMGYPGIEAGIVHVG